MKGADAHSVASEVLDRNEGEAPLLVDVAGSSDVGHAQPTDVVYSARWWVLFVYSMFAMLQGWLWGDLGPISDSMLDVYGINSDTVQLMLNWGPIMYILFSFPFAYAMDRPGGVRVTVVLSMGLVALGAILRAAAPLNSSTTAVGMLHVGYMLNDIAGPVAMSAVTLVSEGWFPRGERGLATAIAAEANVFGNVMSFLVGPAMLAGVDPASGIRRYHYLCAGIALATLAATIIYFPSHAPTPPSHSAATAKAAEERFSLTAFRAALRGLSRNVPFLVLCGAYGLSGGA